MQKEKRIFYKELFGGNGKRTIDADGLTVADPITSLFDVAVRWSTRTGSDTSQATVSPVRRAGTVRSGGLVGKRTGSFLI